MTEVIQSGGQIKKDGHPPRSATGQAGDAKRILATSADKAGGSRDSRAFKIFLIAIWVASFYGGPKHLPQADFGMTDDPKSN